MLIGSPSIYCFLLAFCYIRSTKEDAFSPHSSSSTQSMFVQGADCLRLLLPLRRTRADLRPQHKIILEPHAVDPVRSVEVHGAMLLLKMFKDYDDGASSSSAPSARGVIRAAPAECEPDRWQHMELADSTADSAFTGSPYLACTVRAVCCCTYSDVFLPSTVAYSYLSAAKSKSAHKQFADLNHGVGLPWWHQNELGSVKKLYSFFLVGSCISSGINTISVAYSEPVYLYCTYRIVSTVVVIND